MDVVCDRCKTEYEFDDALVSERGTTVKCTNCGHQFKIFRPSSEGEAARSWNLRRPDGTVIPFDSLAVLQKWILEGRVSKMDEISRSGEGWKPLGAIAELESFFSTAEQRGSSGPPSVRTPSNRPPPSLPGITTGPMRAATPRSVSIGHTPPVSPIPGAKHTPLHPLPPLTATSLRPPPPPTPATGGPKVSAVRAPTPASATALQIPPPPRIPNDLHAPTLGPVETKPPVTLNGGSDAPITPRSKPAIGPPPRLPPSAREVPADDDIETISLAPDEVLPQPRPVRAGSVAIGLTLGALLAGVGAVAAWKLGLFGDNRPGAVAHRPEVSAETELDNAARTALPWTRTAFEDSREALTRALALSPRDGLLLAGRAEVLASWAEQLKLRADDLERTAGAGPEGSGARGEAAALRREASTLIERARTDAREAEGAGTRGAAAEARVHALLADVSRVAGDVPAAQRHLDAVGSAAPEEIGLVRALMARETGAMPEAVEGLRTVLGRSPNNVRARLALARVLAARGDAEGARAEVASVLRGASDHEAATTLSRSLPVGAAGDAGTTVAANNPTPAAVDAGSPAVAALSPTNPTNPTNPTAPANPANPEPGRTGGGGGASEPAVPRDYDALVRDGDQLQNEGRTARARERFQQALAVRPNAPEALAGLGYVALDEHDVALAISRFRQALAASPRYSEAYIGLGESYSHVRNYQQAISAYQHYLEINPNGSRAEMARRQLEALQERVRQSAPSGASGSSGEAASGDGGASSTP